MGPAVVLAGCGVAAKDPAPPGQRREPRALAEDAPGSGETLDRGLGAAVRVDEPRPDGGRPRVRLERLRESPHRSLGDSRVGIEEEEVFPRRLPCPEVAGGAVTAVLPRRQDARAGHLRREPLSDHVSRRVVHDDDPGPGSRLRHRSRRADRLFRRPVVHDDGGDGPGVGHEHILRCPFGEDPRDDRNSARGHQDGAGPHAAQAGT